MPEKYTEARRKSNRKWDAEHLDRLSIALPKGSREEIKVHAGEQGESVNGFIGRAIGETIERDRVRGRRAAAQQDNDPAAGAIRKEA